MDDDGLEKRLARIEKCVDENSRAIRGHNSQVGMASRLWAVESTITKLVENDLPHMKNELLVEIKKLQDDSFSWNKVGKELVGPVIVAIVTALLVAAITGGRVP
jgi:hypothetical protein